MPVPDLNLDRAMARAIGLAMIHACGKQKAAAELLGVSPRVLNYKLRVNGLYQLVAIGLDASKDVAYASQELMAFLAEWTPVSGPITDVEREQFDQIRRRARSELGLGRKHRRRLADHDPGAA